MQRRRREAARRAESAVDRDRCRSGACGTDRASRAARCRARSVVAAIRRANHRRTRVQRSRRGDARPPARDRSRQRRDHRDLRRARRSSRSSSSGRRSRNVRAHDPCRVAAPCAFTSSWSQSSFSGGSRTPTARRTDRRSHCRSRAARSWSTACSMIRPGSARASPTTSSSSSRCSAPSPRTPSRSRSRSRATRSTSARACGRPGPTTSTMRSRSVTTRRRPSASSSRSIRRTRGGSRTASRSRHRACAPTGFTPTTPKAIATRRGIRCGSARRRSSPTAGPPRWRFRSRSCACRASLRRAGASTSTGTSRIATRTCSGGRCRSIAPRGRACSASSSICRRSIPASRSSCCRTCRRASPSTNRSRRRYRIAGPAASTPGSTRSCGRCPGSP